MTLEQSMLLSAIMDQIELEVDFKLTQQQLGASIISQLIRKAYKAKAEIYALVADYMKIPLEEAKSQPLSKIVDMIKEDKAFVSFFSQASK